MADILNWERLNVVVEEALAHQRGSSSQLSFIPGPKGGLRFSGSISKGGGTASCRSRITEGTRPLGFSADTVALRLEVTGDGKRYRVGLRDKDRFWGVSVWQAELTPKRGVRTVVVLPLDKATWYETVRGNRV